MRKKLVKCYIWSIALYGAESWTLRAVHRKHVESFEIWCWRRMEKIILTDHVRKEEVFYVWVSVHHKLIYIKEPTRYSLAVCLFVTAILLYMFRTLFASIFRSTKKL